MNLARTLRHVLVWLSLVLLIFSIVEEEAKFGHPLRTELAAIYLLVLSFWRDNE